MTNTDLYASIITSAVHPEVWMLDPKVVFLNHGSFGSCPLPVLQFQQELRNLIERQPVDFFVRELEGLLDEARCTLARFVGADPQNLVFVSNATTGVNTVLRSLRFEPGDELLVTDHEYNACRNALDFVANLWSCRVVVAQIPFPLQSAGQIIEAVLDRVTDRTRLVLLDHVTSQTGMVMPVAEIIRALEQKGIDSLIDGAHAPGMIPLDLEMLGATYYTGNCHKWLCTPKTAALLYVKQERQHLIHPLSISHGANSPRKDRSRYLIEFGWTGTGDSSAILSVPKAIQYIGSLLPGGWPEIMARNRQLALVARRLLCQILEIPAPCPEELIGTLASLPLPDSVKQSPPISPLYLDPLQDELRLHHGIEVPIIPWPASPKRLIRISAQLYNSVPQYELLAKALRTCFPN